MTIKRLLQIVAGCAMLAVIACNESAGPNDTAPKAKVNIIPLPAQLQETKDSFLLDKQTVLVARTESEKKTAALFNAWLSGLSGYELQIKDSITHNAIVMLVTDGEVKRPAESYSISTSKDRIQIHCTDDAGLFYGMQTLIQLLPAQKANAFWIPGVAIDDQPRFSYRGLHLDVCRHMFPVEFIKKYIDLMAMHKFNTFHWHLTDDQGWRIEIKKYPKLQEIASRRKESMIGHYKDQKFDGKPYGGFYTQEQVKEVVQYAKDRHVTVIPEIEMPGHALAALAAYPYLGCKGGPYEVGTKWGVLDDVFCAGNDSVFVFLQDVLDEVIPLFPGKYIHIGGDECPKVRWEKCPKCQKRMHEHGLKDEHALQSYFIQRMEKYVNSKGRQIIGWDEILEGGLAPNATVMSWRGIEGGIDAAQQHHDVIMTPGNYMYFDHYQSQGKNEPIAIGGFTPVSKVYSFEPVPAELSADEAKYILGAQANLWTEYIGNAEHVEYMVYPRAIALAEVLWSKPEKKDFDNFLERLKAHLPRLDMKNVNYAKHVFEVRGSIENEQGGVQVKLDSKLDGGKIFYTLDSSAPSPKATPYTAPVKIGQTGTFRAAVFRGDEIYGNEFQQSFRMHKAVGKAITVTEMPDADYNPESNFTLVNGIRGAAAFNDNQWSGYYGKNFEAVIDLGDSTEIKELAIGLLQAKDQWIYAPKEVRFYISEDGKNYKEVYKQTGMDESSVTGPFTKAERLQPTKTRYVKFVALNAGYIKKGKPGEGNPAWLFVDELIVR